MHIKILSNSEDVSVWIIEPAKVMQYKCFSHNLLDFSHLFFILGKPNPKEEKPFEDAQLQDRKSKMESELPPGKCPDMYCWKGIL